MQRWPGMKAILVFVALAVLPGCLGPQAAFVDGVSAAWSAIGPEYRGYVFADPLLSEEDRKTRERTADLLDRLLEEARKP